jgi:hypothetical protein
LRLRALAELHRQADAPPFEVHLEHAHLDDLAGLHDLARIGDEAIAELADVHEAVLMHADVQERTEVGDVRDDTLERHARREIGELAHALLEGRSLELGPRITARLLELRDDVGDGAQAKALVRERGRIERPQERGVAHHLRKRQARAREDTLDDGIRLGVNGAAVERVLADLDPEEAGALLERLRPRAAARRGAAAATGTRPPCCGGRRCCARSRARPRASPAATASPPLCRPWPSVTISVIPDV